MAAKCAHTAYHLADVPRARRGAVQLVQLHPAVFGNDARHGGFSHARGAVEHHVGDAAAGYGPAEHLVLGQQVLLAHHLVQALGAQPVGQWGMGHGFASFRQNVAGLCAVLLYSGLAGAAQSARFFAP